MQELGKELQRQRLNRQDFLADTRSLEMELDSYGSMLNLSLEGESLSFTVGGTSTNIRSAQHSLPCRSYANRFHAAKFSCHIFIKGSSNSIRTTSKTAVVAALQRRTDSPKRIRADSSALATESFFSRPDKYFFRQCLSNCVRQCRYFVSPVRCLLLRRRDRQNGYD